MGNKEESPQVAATTQGENTKELGKNLVNSVYLHSRGNSTGVTYATWSGMFLPKEDHVPVLMSLDSVLQLLRGEPLSFELHPSEIAENDRRTAEKKDKERRRKIRQELEEIDYRDQLSDLEEKLAAIERRIDVEVDARMSRGEWN